MTANQPDGACSEVPKIRMRDVFPDGKEPSECIPHHPLQVVHINTGDAMGGAAKVGWRLVDHQHATGHKARLIVGKKQTPWTLSEAFPVNRDPEIAAESQPSGYLDYEFLGSHDLAVGPWVTAADVVHLHNLHGGYFNPFSLPLLSRSAPVVWTLHDMQALTGHCAHAFDCDRWRNGCGTCPDLTIYPPVNADRTADLWRHKQWIYNASAFHLVVPSQWLKAKVEKSMLANHPVDLIYNGVNTQLFRPMDRRGLRRQMGLSEDTIIIGGVANFGIHGNTWKGPRYTRDALLALKDRIPNFLFVNIGGQGHLEDPQIVNIPRIDCEYELSKMYGLMDIYLMTSVADNCPLVILEALSSGTPVVSFATGGVPELVRHERDGLIAGYKETSDVVDALEVLCQDPKKRTAMGRNARQGALDRFDMDRIARQYMDLYRRIIETHPRTVAALEPLSTKVFPAIARTHSLSNAIEIFNNGGGGTPQTPGSPDHAPMADKAYRAITARVDSGADPIGEITAFLEVHPDYPRAHNDLGVYYGQQNHPEAALAHLERAVRLEPANNLFRKNLADYHFAGLGDVETALALYRDVLSRCPDDTDALATVGRICQALGNSSDASTFLNRALELDPHHPIALEGLREAAGTDNTRPARSADALHPIPSVSAASAVLVSAVVSVYQCERFIAGRLENLLEQTLYRKNRLEIIVVDSCSPENERAVVEEFQSRYPNIHYIRTADRETVYQAWNRGIQIAQGTYFVNANSDDRFAPDALERMAQTLEEDRTCHGVYGDWLVTHFENDSFTSDSEKFLYGYPEFHPALLFYLQVTSHATFVRRDVFQRIGLFDGSLKVFGDREFMFRFSTAGFRMRKIDGVVGLYLANPNSLERSKRDTIQTECMPLYEAYGAPEMFAKLHGFREVPDTRALARLYFETGALGKDLYVRNGKPSDAPGSAIWMFQKALAHDPECFPALNNLAVLECAQGKFGQALAHFKAAFAVADDVHGPMVETNMAAAERQHPDAGAYGWVPPEINGYTVRIHPHVEEPEPADANRSRPENKVSPDVPQGGVTLSVIVPISKSSSLQRRCLNAIRQWTPVSHEVLIVPRGLPEDRRRRLQKELQSQAHCRVLETDGDPSVAEAVNTACHHAQGTYVAWVTEDTQVSEGWAESLISVLEKTPDTGIVGPLVSGTAHPGGLGHRYPSDPLTGIPVRLDIPYLTEGCIVALKTCLDAVGQLDERFHTGRYLLRDFCLRARMDGYRPRLTADIAVTRKTDGRRSDAAKHVANDRRLFLGKWSGIDVQSELGKKLLVARALEKAGQHIRAGRLDRGVHILIEAIGLAPDDGRVYAALGAHLLNASRYQDAMGVVREMPEGMDDLSDSLMGYCLEGLHQYPEAAEMTDRVLARSPDHSRAWNLKGILAYRDGDNDLSRKCFEKAVAGDPSDGEPFTNLGVLAWEAGHPGQGMDWFERGFMLNPLSSDGATAYHAAAIACDELERACRVFETASMLYPGDRQVRFLLIDLLIRLQCDEQAMDAIEAAAVEFDLDDGFLAAARSVRERLGSMTLPATDSKTPTVSLCMIVKNEERLLAPCLRSLKPLVHEMIIVDTGSTDRTRELAGIFGATVIDHEWTEDFAAARNVSLEHASGDWILVMDADEVISPQDVRRFRRLLGKKSSRRTAFLMTTRNYYEQPNITGWIGNDGTYPQEEAGSGWMASRKVRLFPNDPRIRFEKPVHELVEYSLIRANIPIRPHPVPVHHYGKLNTQNTRVKGKTYYALGETKLNSDARNVKALIELARQASELEDHQRSVELWQQVVEKKPGHAQAYLNLSNAHMVNRDYTAARDAAARAMKLQPDLKEAYLNYAASEFIAGDPSAAGQTLKDLLKREPDYPPAVGLLATYYCLGGKAEKWRQIIRRLGDLGYNCAEFLLHRARQFVAADKQADAIQLLEASVEVDCADRQMLALLAELYADEAPDSANTHPGSPVRPNPAGTDAPHKAMKSSGVIPDRA